MPLLGVLMLVFALAAAAPAPRAWLDSNPPTNWNLPGAAVPAAPPWVVEGARNGKDPDLAPGGRCAGILRPATRREERAVARKGWSLYKQSPDYGGALQPLNKRRLAVFMGTSGADGMCRPLGFQIFVFVRGVYAGTISPQVMNSRTDASFSDAHATGPLALQADFARYADQDALCCPHAVTHVSYTIQTKNGRPVVVPGSAVTTAYHSP